MFARIRSAVAFPLLVLVFAVSCSEPTAPETPEPGQEANEFLFWGRPTRQLLECPSTTTQSASGPISAVLGGTITLGGHRVTIPGGALLSDAVVTLTEPASQYMEIELKVDGNAHFFFQREVLVTISYDRCRSSGLFRPSYSAWYINSDTKAKIEDMGGFDNKLFRRVTFTTPHFSAYAVAE
jgi:hypothetical protein